jgi:endonuclease-3
VRALGSAGLSAVATWRRPRPRRVRAIRDRLRDVYGVPLAKPHGRPIAELVLTVLSQSTNDRNRDVAYLALRERFASWEEVRDAPVDLVEEAIRPGGISRVKSARIKAILSAVTETAPGGELSLDWLPSLPVPKAQAYLCALPGVGRKTAACVLLFALGMRDVPVDTHVSRVGTRLGLFRPGRRSRSCTTRCSRSPHAARSSSFTSTCSATAAEPVTPADQTAQVAP